MRSLALLTALASGLTGCGGVTGADDGSADTAPRDAARDRAAHADAPGAHVISDAAWHDAQPPDASVTGGKVCVQAAQVRRDCTGDSDCVAVLRVTSCCGAAVWMGIRASAVTSFATLEAACERSYSDCTCFAPLPTTDDGSLVDASATGAVTASCQAGTCKTFATDCGRPCPDGASCASCTAHGTTTAVCAHRCTKASDCLGTPGTTCEAVSPFRMCVAAQTTCRSF